MNGNEQPSWRGVLRAFPAFLSRAIYVYNNFKYPARFKNILLNFDQVLIFVYLFMLKL
jgi:hypothetical protein